MYASPYFLLEYVRVTPLKEDYKFSGDRGPCLCSSLHQGKFSLECDQEPGYGCKMLDNETCCTQFDLPSEALITSALTSRAKSVVLTVLNRSVTQHRVVGQLQHGYARYGASIKRRVSW